MVSMAASLGTSWTMTNKAAMAAPVMPVTVTLRLPSVLAIFYAAAEV